MQTTLKLKLIKMTEQEYKEIRSSKKKRYYSPELLL